MLTPRERMMAARRKRDPNDPTGAKKKRRLGKKRKPRGDLITKKTLAAAIEDSGGSIAEIARRLEVTRPAVYMRLKDWPEMKELLDEERARMIDTSQDTMEFLVSQRKHLPTALGAAKWVLERQGGMIQTTKVQVEGGDTPVRIEQAHNLLPAAVLNLPLDLKKKILDSINGNHERKTIKVQRILP